jgi:hypothetical protein
MNDDANFCQKPGMSKAQANIKLGIQSEKSEGHSVSRTGQMQRSQVSWNILLSVFLRVLLSVLLNLKHSLFSHLMLWPTN